MRRKAEYKERLPTCRILGARYDEVMETESSAEKIIEQSGNSFHARVAKLMEEKDWKVMVSPHYSDAFSDKPREIDILGEKSFYAKTPFYDDTQGLINIRVVIECKYIKDKTVFWFGPKDKERTIERIMDDTGLQDPRQNAAMNTHHYFKDVPVAQLWDNKKGERELINNAINQSLNATIYYRDQSNLFPLSGYRQVVRRRVTYPLIVVSSLEHFYRTSMDGTEKPSQINNPFQIQKNYAYPDKNRNGMNEYFLIDVVDLKNLADFLDSIETSDVRVLQEKIGWDDYQQRQHQSQRGNNSAR